MQDAAKTLGIRLDSQEVMSPVNLADVLELFPTTGMQALLNAGDTMLNSQSPSIVAFAAKRHLPAIYENREYVNLGGLMSFTASAVVKFGS